MSSNPSDEGSAARIATLEHELKCCTFRAATEEQLLAGYLDRFPETLSYRISREDAAYLDGKRVMILGGGGSIGQQLARDLVGFPVEEIILVDINENGLYEIQQELTQIHGVDPARVKCVLGNKAARRRMQAVLDDCRPQIVFDFANYKSLVFGNLEPQEFFRVNVGATQTLMRAAAEHGGVERFVYVSSDKAEMPTSPYGMTKRLAELAAQRTARQAARLKVGIIRFCNVLDAAGSFALRAFRRQILERQPVTIRKVEGGKIPYRYFIPKRLAAQLTLKVGQLADRGNVFSLDKKSLHPVRIDELVRLLAQRFTTEPIDQWMKRNVTYVAGHKGEKCREDLGRGAPLSEAPLIELLQAQRGEELELDDKPLSVQRIIAFMDDPAVSKHIEQVLNGTLTYHEALTERRSRERIRSELDALFAKYGY